MMAAELQAAVSTQLEPDALAALMRLLDDSRLVPTLGSVGGILGAPLYTTA